MIAPLFSRHVLQLVRLALFALSIAVVMLLTPGASFAEEADELAAEPTVNEAAQTPAITDEAKSVEEDAREATADESAVEDATASAESEPAPAEKPAPAPEVVETAPAEPKRPSAIRVATWDGAYGEAQEKTVFQPFAERSGITVERITHGGWIKPLTDGASDTSAWDVADVSYRTATEACQSGAVSKIDVEKLRTVSKDGFDIEDFIPEAVAPCAIGASVWSALIAFDRTKFSNRAPSKLEDFFDLKKFPGKRALPQQPRYVLEMALMADGVTPPWVYSQLDSEAGLKRAFDKLETIRKQIVWWQSARDPVKLINDGKAAMALGFNGRFFVETAARDSAIGLLWDGQIFDMNVWVIPNGSAHKEAALEFISYAVQADVMVRQASLFPYGPTRRSAARNVERHPSLPVDLQVYLPTAPDNFGRALHSNDAWWEENRPRILERFRQWLNAKG